MREKRCSRASKRNRLASKAGSHGSIVARGIPQCSSPAIGGGCSNLRIRVMSSEECVEVDAEVLGIEGVAVTVDEEGREDRGI